MIALVAAKAVFLVHFTFLMFVIFGGLLVAWRVRWAWLHVPALMWGTWIVLSHGLCPLTRLEQQLLSSAGVASYSDNFIDHYLVPVIYPPGLTPGHQTWLGVALVIWNAALYAVAFYRWRYRTSPST